MKFTSVRDLRGRSAEVCQHDLLMARAAGS